MTTPNAELLRLLERHHIAWIAEDRLRDTGDYLETPLCEQTEAALGFATRSAARITSSAPTEGATMKDSHGQTVQQPVGMSMMGMQTPTTLEICVQDYREYTAEEILREIVKFTEQAGWGDPANLGHWLGAAQRWAKERV